MSINVPLSKIKKIKTNFNKWFTKTQLIDKEIRVQLQEGVIRFYSIEAGAILGINIEVKDIKAIDKVYKCSYEEFSELKYVGKVKDMINIDIDIKEQKMYFKNEENDLFVKIEEVEISKEETIYTNELNSIKVNNFLLENTFEFFKNILPKNDEIEGLNYTNFNLSDKLYLSGCNLISVGVNSIDIENPSGLKWIKTIHNDYVYLLLKWLKSNNIIDTNIYSENDYMYLYNLDSFIKIPVCKNEEICKLNNLLIEFKDLEGDKTKNINLSEVKEGLKNTLLPYKGDNQLSDKCIPYDLVIGGTLKRINSYQLNKIVGKINEVEIFLLSEKVNSPIVILDNISNSKIIFNVIAN